jgi:hypothetical protein
MAMLRKQESPADRILPACSGSPTSWQLVGLDRPPAYFGGVAAELLLLPSAGAVAAPLLLLVSAGAAGVMAGAGGAGVAAGGVVSVLLQAESTSAAAMALRASFVFIDGSPKLFETDRIY